MQYQRDTIPITNGGPVDTIKFLLRLPEDVWADMKAWAGEDDRSLHGQILYVLRRALKEWR
jgi:hypothetical protein